MFKWLWPGDEVSVHASMHGMQLKALSLTAHLLAQVPLYTLLVVIVKAYISAFGSYSVCMRGAAYYYGPVFDLLEATSICQAKHPRDIAGVAR